MRIYYLSSYLALASAFTSVHKPAARSRPTPPQGVFMDASDSSQSDEASNSEESDEKELKSAAMDWAKKEEESKKTKVKKRLAVVGGGWGGWVRSFSHIVSVLSEWNQAS